MPPNRYHRGWPGAAREWDRQLTVIAAVIDTDLYNCVGGRDHHHYLVIGTCNQ